eukprot:6195118-Pleurochrysis_carterae.AAC.5
MNNYTFALCGQQSVELPVDVWTAKAQLLRSVDHHATIKTTLINRSPEGCNGQRQQNSKLHSSSVTV